MDKKNKIIIGVSIFALVVVAFFGLSQNIFGGQNMGVSKLLYGNKVALAENQPREITWQNMNVNLESTYFGSLTFKQKSGDAIISGCGAGTNEVSISNSFNQNNELTLSSSVTRGYSNSCNTERNFIEAEITPIKDGVIVIEYSLSEYAGGAKRALPLPESSLLIKKGLFNTETIVNDDMLKVGEKRINVSAGEEIIVNIGGVLQSSNSGASASSKAVISFIEDEEDEEVVEVVEEVEEVEVIVKEVECLANIECQNKCGEKTPTCEDNLCFCSGKKLLIEIEETPVYLYAIPVAILGLLALIIWQMRKKPKR